MVEQDDERLTVAVLGGQHLFLGRLLERDLDETVLLRQTLGLAQDARGGGDLVGGQGVERVLDLHRDHSALPVLIARGD